MSKVGTALLRIRDEWGGMSLAYLHPKDLDELQEDDDYTGAPREKPYVGLFHGVRIYDAKGTLEHGTTSFYIKGIQMKDYASVLLFPRPEWNAFDLLLADEEELLPSV